MWREDHERAMNRLWECKIGGNSADRTILPKKCLRQPVPSLADVAVGTAPTGRKTSVPPVGRRKTRIFFRAGASGSSFSAKVFPFRLSNQHSLIAFAKTAVGLEFELLERSGDRRKRREVSASSVPRIRLGRVRDSASRARHLSWSNSMEDSVLYQGHKA